MKQEPGQVKTGTQLYIGAPNGVVVCVDSRSGADLGGRLYHKYSREPVTFTDTAAMIRGMERLFDRLNFPRASTNIRSFAGQDTHSIRTAKEMEKVMSDHELLGQHGYQETFIVRVQHRQNSTWQGRITWADKDKTVNFRSIWEMVRLMESALEEEAPEEEGNRPADWEDNS